MADELRSSGITVNAIAPGAVNTALTQTLIDAGPAATGAKLFEKTLTRLKVGGANPENAAALASYLLGEAGKAISGKLISAVWDDWSQLHQQPEFLKLCLSRSPIDPMGISVVCFLKQCHRISA